MKSHIGFAVLLLLVFLGTGIGQGQSVTPNPVLRSIGNGVWWDSLSNATKETFVDGYATAMARAHHTTDSECKSTTNDAKPGSSDFNSTFTAGVHFCLLAESFNFDFDKAKLAEGIDKFYEDSRNTRVPIDFSMEYVKDQLKGKRPAKDLDDELRGWREILNK
jgi:hypothetical protein